jgi:tetratricopeptide (TPR) repeat protein
MKSAMLLFLSLVCFALSTFSQNLTMAADGGNKKASVSERIGITDVTIHYDRPAVKGREGKVWGTLVHKGFADLGFGKSKAAPWRAGANENTIITFSTDVMVEGKPLKAGSYGFFIAYDDENPLLIFNNDTQSWGSYFYDEKQDALRVNVKPVKLSESVERLKYEFSDETENSAVVALMWEKLKIPFKIDVDYVKTQMESFRKELKSNKGFNPDAWVQAAQFAVDHNINFEEASEWIDYAINGPFIGKKNFRTLSVKAAVLEKMNKTTEAAATMKEALPLATMMELHQYGRKLLSDKKPKEALEIFKLNAQKNPNTFTTNVGLARGYSASGDFKSALKYAKAAAPQAPDKPNKDAVENMLKLLQEEKDVNM